MCGLLSLAEASTSLTVPIVAPLIACDFKLSREQATMPVATSSFGISENVSSGRDEFTANFFPCELERLELNAAGLKNFRVPCKPRKRFQATSF